MILVSVRCASVSCSISAVFESEQFASGFAQRHFAFGGGTEKGVVWGIGDVFGSQLLIVAESWKRVVLLIRFTHNIG
jgi:hypothetical protein